jgi:hypothetical protein
MNSGTKKERAIQLRVESPPYHYAVTFQHSLMTSLSQSFCRLGAPE